MTAYTRILATLIAIGILAPFVHGQFHDFDPAATKAFEEMIEAHRAIPVLSVKSTIGIELLQDDITAHTDTLEAEFFLTNDKRGIVKLRGFTVHLTDGAIWAIHDGKDDAYFTISDEGSPYYTLMAMFMDLPFPHLAIYLGERDTEELCMQFHTRAPWIRPTAVREETRAVHPQQDGDANEQRTVRILELTSQFEKMKLVIDPNTNLIESLDLEITGGGFVREGATLVYRQTFESTVHAEPFDEKQLVFDAGDREQVLELRSLIPRRVVAGGERRGVAHGGMIGRVAPSITLEQIDGGVLDLDDLRGQVIVLDFWATWCPPCIRGIPLLHEVQNWAIESALPVRVITVNTMEIFDPQENTPDARREQAANFWRRNNFTLPVAMDYTDEAAAAFAVNSIPATFVIRSDGVIHSQHVGVPPDYVEQLKNDIREAISALEY